jgi:benzoate-CoA ligase family protein
LTLSSNVYHNAGLYLEQAVEMRGSEAVAILTPQRQVSYGKLLSSCRRFAELLHQTGVRREERVLLAIDDSPIFVAAFMGALRLGAIPVPVNPYYNTDHYEYFVDDIRPRAAVVGSETRTKFETFCAKLSYAPELLIEEELDGLLDSTDEHRALARTHRDDPAFMLYTSGSSGRPKAVVHLHHHCAAAAAGFPTRILRMSHDDVTCSTAKLCHAYGLAENLLAPLALGATTVLAKGRPSASSIIERIEQFRPTLLFSIPTHYRLMLEEWHASERPYDFGPLRLCVSAGEPLPASICQDWREITGLAILDAIGSTELFQMYCSNRPDDARDGSTGKPVPGCELRIVDEAGNDAEVEEAGELYVASDTAIAYYWHDSERTKARCLGRWFTTGDRFRRDRDGYYWYEGRVDDMFKAGGLWVSPSEIEEVLIQHPDVAGAAVIGLAVNDFTLIKAFVVLRVADADRDALALELREMCKSQLQRHRYPRDIEFVDTLPTTLSGKVQRFKLRAESTAFVSSA